ncbi:hypothetical protein ACJJTC_019405 [Scirpophaga incertulas]
METDHFDTDLFIDEIQKRPAIWDMESSTLMKKWKSIRDNYMREAKRQKKLPSGSGSSKHTVYVYYRKLQFLANSTANNDTESNYQSSDTSASGVDNTDNADLMPPPKEHIESTTKKQKMNAVDKQIIDILQKSLNAKEQNETGRPTKEDDDKLFCLSLYSELKKWSTPPPPPSSWSPSPTGSSQDSDSLDLFE